MFGERRDLSKYTSKYLEVRQKYSVSRPIFNSLLSVWKRAQTRSFVIDILLQLANLT